MATKTIYICDYCGKEQAGGLTNLSLRLVGSGVQYRYHEFGELCEGCVSHVMTQLEEVIRDIGDNCTE